MWHLIIIVYHVNSLLKEISILVLPMNHNTESSASDHEIACQKITDVEYTTLCDVIHRG